MQSCIEAKSIGGRFAALRPVGPSAGVSKRDALLEMTRMYFTAEEAQGLGLPAKRARWLAALGHTCAPECPPP